MVSVELLLWSLLVCNLSKSHSVISLFMTQNIEVIMTSYYENFSLVDEAKLATKMFPWQIACCGIINEHIFLTAIYYRLSFDDRHFVHHI
ncbi:hypothetical protein L6452_01569 [Arctium lappa]|uniref:Uncharacterized protein n=1 Tax=Arctium lappa TaxID=4217 RepID=A0ACB9FHH0_ARCLA|nr:hypothetical protein L6452_01569 [Arctium lappa]